MARTKGHGNPDWTRDEVLLALDLYFDFEGKIPSKTHQRVKDLSDVLRSLPYHAAASRKPSFRNPDGVAFKLQNLRSVSTQKGLQNVSVVDRQIWLEFGKQPQRVKELATLIKDGLAELESLSNIPHDDEIEFFEGRIITELHKRRERSPKIRNKLLSLRQKSGQLRCEMCGNEPFSTNPSILDAQYEAHHVAPLASRGSRLTRLDEMALLCAICHRLLHRAIAFKKKWLGIAEAKELCGFR